MTDLYCPTDGESRYVILGVLRQLDGDLEMGAPNVRCGKLDA